MPRILVTRPSGQAEAFGRRLEQIAAEPVYFPVIETQAVTPHPDDMERLSHWGRYSLAIFVSINAVRFFEALVSPEQAMPRLAAVGARTAAALKDAGMHVSLVPEQGFTSEDLLSLPELQQVSGSDVLIIKGEGGRRLIADTLRERGAQVYEVAVYRRITPETDIQPIVEQVNAGDIDLIALTSIEIAENLVSLLGDAAQQHLYDIPVLAGSARIAARADDLGFNIVLQADDPSDESMSAAVLQWMNGDRA